MTIFCDLSEVFVHGLYDLDEILASRFGTGFAEKYKLRHEETYATLLMDLFRGKMTEDAYWTRFMASGDWPEGITPKVFESALSENLKKKIPGTLGVFQRIYGYQENNIIVEGIPKIVLVSDHIKERIQELMMEHYDVFEIFDETYWSCDFGMIKQDKGFFDRALAMAEVAPKDVIYIDDYGKNLQAARNAGIEKTVLFTKAPLLEIALEGHGFIFEPMKK